MAQRVILHIGSMKSGTSFIQNVLGNNREALAEQGVDFTGRRWRHQVKGVQDLIARGGPDQPPLEADGPWRRLARQVDRWQGTSVISMEFLAPRAEHKIRLALDSFDAPVEVVLTGRDLARNLAAMWLESVQNGSSVRWEDYLAAAEAGRTTPVGRNFWNHQGLAEIARRWSGLVGDDRFTLVTVPQKGAPPELLWERFAGLLGVDPQGYELGVRANSSIGLATAMVLRDLNERYEAEPATSPDEAGDARRFQDLIVKHLLTKRSLVQHGAREPKLGVDQRWVIKRGTVEVDRLRKDGHRVIGDLEELLPRPVAGVQPADVSLADQHEASMAALTRMVQIATRREDMHRRQLKRVRADRS